MKYTVADVRPWKKEGQVMADDNGRFGMSLSLEGQGEPVDYFSTIIPKVGDEITGIVQEYQSRKGGYRRRLDDGRIDFKQALIMSQWAFGNALDVAPDHEAVDKVQEYAEALLDKVMETARKYS